MTISVNIVDQRVKRIADDNKQQYADDLNIRNDSDKANSVSYVYLVVKTLLDLSHEDIMDGVVEGGNDMGIDALYLTPPNEGEFVVTLIQGKYKRELSGQAAFPETGITAMVSAIGALFDPGKVIHANARLRAKVEEVRSLVAEGELPKVHVVLCNNGVRWTSTAQAKIEQAGFGEQVTWQYVGPEEVIKILQAPKKVNDTLQLTGKAFVEDFDFRRALIGRMAVGQLAALFDRHGDRLLERNIRRYLGLAGNRVNEAVSVTLRAEEQRGNFYFYNNGITITCSRFRHNALQQENWQVQVEGLQIVNGGQTSRTVQHVVKDSADAGNAQVLVRIYELPEQDEELVKSITYATNSQNPVDLRDLKSNDPKQVMIEHSISELGFTYRRQRAEGSTSGKEITSTAVAEAVLAVWRHRPHQARFLTTEHFGKLYDKIFTKDLNGAQAIIAALVMRYAENRRKRPWANAPDFLPYSSRFVAMLMGKKLLEAMGNKFVLADLDHRTFDQAQSILVSKAESIFMSSLESIDVQLHTIFDCQPRTLQKLSATFRRSDLVENLIGHPLTA